MTPLVDLLTTVIRAALITAVGLLAVAATALGVAVLVVALLASGLVMLMWFVAITVGIWVDDYFERLK